LPGSTPYKALLHAQEEMQKRNEEFLLSRQQEDPGN
jgi:hypothetical protein